MSKDKKLKIKLEKKRKPAGSKNQAQVSPCVMSDELKRVGAVWIPGFVGLYAYNRTTQILYYTHLNSRTLRSKANNVGCPFAWTLHRHGECLGTFYADQIEYMIDNHELPKLSQKEKSSNRFMIVSVSVAGTAVCDGQLVSYDEAVIQATEAIKTQTDVTVMLMQAVESFEQNVVTSITNTKL
jgi:hypothetical protein